MIKVIKKRLKNQKGLTLVELLAVVVILGIIAAIAVPAIGNIIEKQRVEAHNANITMFDNAARMYVLSEEPTNDFDVATIKNKGFLEEVPKDPRKGDDRCSDYGSGVTYDNTGKNKTSTSNCQRVEKTTN